MKKVLLIGNSGRNKTLNGQTIKVRLYRDLLIKEKINFIFIDLKDFSRKPLSTLRNIKKSIADCERIVLLTAQRGVKILIPFINACNKKYNRTFILPMIGINILHKYTDRLSETQNYSFFHDCDFGNVKPSKRDIRQLKKISYILPENETIKNVLIAFFKLKNVFVLQNFRDSNFSNLKSVNRNDSVKLLFLSRVAREKGVFELINVVRRICVYMPTITLDIYGEEYLKPGDIVLFNSLLCTNVRYMGPCKNESVIQTISNYDLFVFPTLYKGEGTPGVIAESFIAGVPILSSNFIQAKELMNNGIDSIIYEPPTEKKLEETLLDILNNKKYISLAKNVINTRKQYLYEYNRDKFLQYICGINLEREENK